MDSSTPTPKSILRGHKSQIHAAAFVRSNERLITADADGFVVLWDLTIMRARAVWRAHEKALLGVRGWGDDKIITHGRDMKLIVWKLGEAAEEHLSTALPVENVPTPRAQPWILHLLEVNTLNFCAFAFCSSVPGPVDEASEALIAVPNTLNSDAIDIYHLPSQHRIHTIKAGDKTGMAMCLALLHHENALTLVAAFENGYATVQRLGNDGRWVTTYNSQAHSQPVLSLSVHDDSFITSSADSIVAKHPIPTDLFFPLQGPEPPQSTERVVEIIDDEPKATSLLSAGLKASSFQTPTGPSKKGVAWKDPIKTINTKHSGQQSLDIRSDGRIFATAGWDSKVRVYSVKTMKELAVLKWHQVGCFAVAFADVKISDKAKEESTATAQQEDGNKATTSLTKRTTSLVKAGLSVKEQRIETARQTHWIAAGAKDGKISLWDVY
ncbi:WD40-repeat-containing domain protein [Fusarium venenatum]|uniref:WD40-repeat-containing domain protein n=1 Tax=Fusarium venenatum TaxID=56646 RepID=UPI001DE3EDB9|nr:WD40-repeat-containing domain protein [Fusarium venenatum]